MFRSPVIDALVVIVVLLLIVGPKKLPQLGRGLGDGMREFKDGITGSNKGGDENTGSVSLRPVNEAPSSGATDERPTQPAGAPRETGSEPRA